MTDLQFIQAADETGRPKVVGMAYGGGKINLGWGEPVVVDLAGMTIPETVPLLQNHDNRTSSRVGVVAAKVVDGTLEIEGEIISETEDAANIVAQGKAGADWQLSIGADVQKGELVKANRVVNGQELEAPFYLVSASALREVSVVAVGADASTIMKIAASFNLQGGKELMSEETKSVAAEATVNVAAEASVQTAVPESIDVKAAAETAVKAERQRIADIKDVCAGEFPEIENEAIKAGWDANTTRTKVLEAYRSNKPETSVNISVKSDTTDAKSLEAAFAIRAGLSADELCKTLGEQAVEAGMKNCDMSIRDLMKECLRVEGHYTGRTFDNETIRAAFSTVSLPGILGNVANKRMLKSFNEHPIIATKLCSVGDLNDFKEADRLRLTDVGDLLPVSAAGEIKAGSLTEERATNKLETYGKQFCLTRQMIINDDLGALLKVPTAMGNRAARLIDQLFFSRLLGNPVQGDGKNLFSADHKNLLTGADSALSIASLQKAVAMFLDQTDADGSPISVEAKYLVVPTALKFLATELTRGSNIIIAGNTDKERAALNALADENLQVVSSPYLGNGAYAGASQTGWYLFGDPRQVDTFEIGYLKGKRTPTVEKGDTDFNTLGMWFRVYFDVGVREQGFRGMVKANGAA